MRLGHSQPAPLISIGHLQRHRASQSPSAISLAESGSKAQSAAPMLIGSRQTPPRRSPSVISLTDSEPDVEAAQAAPSISIGPAQHHHRPALHIPTRHWPSRSPSVISLTDSESEDMQGDRMPSPRLKQLALNQEATRVSVPTVAHRQTQSSWKTFIYGQLTSMSAI